MSSHLCSSLADCFRVVLALTMLLTAAQSKAAPSLSNLTLNQRSGTRIIDLTYNLSAPGLTSVGISLEISSDGGSTWTVPATSVTGAIGGNVVPGNGKTIVWNAGTDWPDQINDQMRFRLTVDEGFARIPAGPFTMGRTNGESNAPPVTVTVSEFYMQKTETTKAQWDEVQAWAVNNGYTDLPTAGGKAPNHPAHSVNWFDSIKWCNARSEKESLTPAYKVSGAVMRTGTTVPDPDWTANGYRLPTEAEWEKAARGGISGKLFPWGGDTINHDNANYYASSTASTWDVSGYLVNTFHPLYATGAEPFTSPVSSFDSNNYGIFDMAGNLWEWCWDWYSDTYYSNDRMNPPGPDTGAYRVVRGGSYITLPWGQTCSYRLTLRLPQARSNNRGFRPARSINSGSATTDIISIDTRVPEIELEQPTGTALVDGSATSTWQALPIGGAASPVTYLIRNVGQANLLNLGLAKSGTDASDFLLGDLTSTTLVPGQSATFTVTFTPGARASGPRSATLQVASNDPDENPFDIALTGEVYSTTLDADSDGMNDWGEYKLSALGFDWQVPNTALVSTYYDNAEATGLVTTSQVQNLNVGVPLLRRNLATGEFTLTIGVDQSTNLTNWTPLPMTVPQTIINSQGKVEFRFTTPDNAAFFRLQTQPTP